jgi:hypothetical protein
MMALTSLALVTTSASIDAFLPERYRGGQVFRHLSSRNTISLYALSPSSASAIAVIDIPTKPIPGMKPGTSGLRKKVETWQAIDPSNEHYLENFIQSLIDTATATNDGKVPQTYVHSNKSHILLPIA